VSIGKAGPDQKSTGASCCSVCWHPIWA
jgi:hypothetical protein